MTTCMYGNTEEHDAKGNEVTVEAYKGDPTAQRVRLCDRHIDSVINGGAHIKN